MAEPIVKRFGGPTMVTNPYNFDKLKEVGGMIAKVNEPLPLPGATNPADTQGRIDAGLAIGKDWVNQQVPDQALGRHSDSFQGQATNLIGTQTANLAGYDSDRMREAARANASALAGAGKAFTGKVGGHAAAAMAPGLLNATQQYQTGVRADNADARARASQALGEYVPRAASEELKMAQANRELGQKEQTLRATLPFDVAQLLESTRSGILGQQDADWFAELARRNAIATGKLNRELG
jgi:hypothetical protein